MLRGRLRQPNGDGDVALKRVGGEIRREMKVVVLRNGRLREPLRVRDDRQRAEQPPAANGGEPALHVSELSFALNDGNLQRELAALADDADRGRGADFRIGDQPDQVRRIVDGLAVERHDDVGGLKARLVGGRAAIDLIHERAARVANAELGGQLRRERVELHPAERARGAPRRTESAGR